MQSLAGRHSLAVAWRTKILLALLLNGEATVKLSRHGNVSIHFSYTDEPLLYMARLMPAFEGDKWESMVYGKCHSHLYNCTMSSNSAHCTDNSGDLAGMVTASETIAF